MFLQSHLYCVEIKIIFDYLDPNLCYHCRVVCGHGAKAQHPNCCSRAITGLLNAQLRRRKENERNRIAGVGTFIQLVIAGEQ